MTVEGGLDTHAGAEVSDAVRAPIRSCLCRLGGEVVAVALQAAREFVRVDHLTAVPRTPPHLLGVMSLRGRIVPVVDIRPVLGLAPDAPLGRGCHALVVQAGTVDLAIAVEEIVGLDSVSTESTDDETPRATPFRTWCVRPDGAAVSLLNVGRIAEALRPVRRSERRRIRHEAATFPDVRIRWARRGHSWREAYDAGPGAGPEEWDAG